jgi:aminoglycoside/choline kinase family phosphotransferase
MSTTFPAQPEQLTDAWLTATLRASGAIGPSSTVTSCTITPVGAGIGLLGLVMRLHLTYADGPGPASLVVKFAHPVEANRAIAMNTRMYEREVTFFNEIAASVDVPKPVCHFAAVDTVTGENIVLLEDLGHYRVGDQVDGVALEEARQIIDAIVPLHAAFWGRTDDPLLDDAMRVDSSYVERFMPSVLGTWERGVELFAHVIAPEVLPDVPRYVAAMRGLHALMGRRTQTVVHGDVRLDNVMFGQQPDHHPVMLIDWQAIMVSNPVHDLSYLLTQSMPTDLRRAHEAELIARYHERLLEHGVTDYTLEQCTDDYDVGALYLFSYPLIIGGVCDVEQPRGIQLAEAVLSRSSQAIADRGLLRLID